MALFGADDWLRLGLLDTFVGWFHKKVTTCEHGPTPHAPQPTWSAAWKSRGSCLLIL